MHSTKFEADIVVFLATAWGTKHGGINAFNANLARAMAQETEHPVVCFVCGLQAPAEREGVILLPSPGDGDGPLDPQYAPSITKTLREKFPRTQTPCWIGHDRITGALALACNKDLPGRSVVIQHMDHGSYEVLKDGNGEAALRKEEEQVNLIRAADVPCGVGPKLARLARSRVDPNKNHLVPELIPGLAEIDLARQPATFSAITFGRFDTKSEPVKQCRLAVAGFARAIAIQENILGQDPKITVVGVDHNSDLVRELDKLSYKIAKRKIVINASPYIEDQENFLFDLLSRQSVAIMPSFHEGFGLVGWEAISAGVPLILSKNSGLYQLLDDKDLENCVFGVDIRGGATPDDLNPADIDAVARQIIDVAIQKEKSRRRAESLRRELRSRFSWKSTAIQLANASGLSVRRTPLHLLLAAGYPSTEICGPVVSSPEELNADQLEARRLWSVAASKIAFEVSKYTNPRFRVLYSGVDGGNFAAGVVRELSETHHRDADIETITHTTFANDKEAYEYYSQKSPNYFGDCNVDQERPYVYLPGEITRVNGLDYRREILVNRADAILCVSGLTSVDYMIALAMARNLPFIAIPCFGGRTQERAEEIMTHNRSLGLPPMLLHALENLARAPLQEDILVNSITRSMEMMIAYWKDRVFSAV